LKCFQVICPSDVGEFDAIENLSDSRNSPQDERHYCLDRVSDLGRKLLNSQADFWDRLDQDDNASQVNHSSSRLDQNCFKR